MVQAAQLQILFISPFKRRTTSSVTWTNAGALTLRLPLTSVSPLKRRQLARTSFPPFALCLRGTRASRLLNPVPVLGGPETPIEEVKVRDAWGANWKRARA